ncbi:MAG TPA: Ig-like domain-containing protein [Gemmatimonadaceae bacterium]|nr:Ig-like domain-containing protein [Gemmatimonadaceae bacterium]
MFSRSAAAAFAELDDFGITFDHVHVVVVQPPADTVADTVVAFAPGQADLTLDLTVPVVTDGETFNAGIDYTNPSGVVFHGEGTVQSHSADQPAPTQQITVQYTGPGASVAHLTVSPKTTTIVAPGTATFTVAAVDANNSPVPNVPINWTSSDPTVATISNSGVLTTTGKRGTVTVTATSVTSATDNATATINLPPTGIQLVSGGGQTGKAGSALAQPAVVRVTASDGVGVAGVPVSFIPPSGGKVGAASVTTDGSGSASTSLTLGGTAGPQAFAAVAEGFNVGITATATAAAPANIVVVSGGGQKDTVKRVLQLPLVAKVTDQFGNATPGIAVSWSRIGAGTPSATSTTTGADGTTSITYTFGTTTGTESISASVAGVSASASFSETVVAGVAAGLVIVSGDAQTGRILTALAPLVVKATDAGGNPVSGATVTWTATNGTITSPTTTDATGTSSNVMTLGSVAGTASATATVGSQSVGFSATVTAGLVAKIVFVTGAPSSSAAGLALSPPIQVALQDAAGNPTAAANPVSIAIGTNPTNAVLSGTLTRNAVAGVAAFNDLAFDRAGTGFTLIASSAGATSISTAAFDVTSGVAPHVIVLAGEGQTAAVNTAVEVAPSVKLVDIFGRPVSGVAVTFAPTAGGAVAPATPVTTNESGIATLTSWTMGRVAGTENLAVSASGYTGATLAAAATPGAPAGITFVQQPSSATAGTAITPAPALLIIDAFNNVVTSSNATISLAISPRTGTPGAHLGGTSSIAAVAGVATFTSLTIDLGGSAYRLDATSGGFGIQSNPFDITAGSATQLVASGTPPATGQDRASLPAVGIQLQDASHANVAVAGIAVTAALTSGPSGGTLVGTTTATTTASGIASFGAFGMQGPVGLYTIQFTSAGLAPVSLAFTNTPGLVVTQAWITQPAGGQATTTLPPASVGVYDIDNNLVTTATGSFAVPITAVITAGTGTSGAVLSGGSAPVNTVNGVATFTNLSIDRSGTAYKLDAVNGTTSGRVTSAAFNVGSGPAASLTWFGAPYVTTVGAPLASASYPTVLVRDALGNPVAGASVLVQPALGNCAEVVGGVTLTTDATGKAALTSTSLTVNTSVAGACLMVATTMTPALSAESDVLILPAGSVGWTGSVNNNWNTAANWSNNAAPTSGTSIFVPQAAVTQPRLSSNAAVGSVLMEAVGSSLLDIDGFTLTVNGDLSATTIVNSGSGGGVVLAKNGSGNLTGSISVPVQVGTAGCSGTDYVVGGTTTTQDVTVTCGTLDAGTQQLIVNGQFKTQNTGTLTMTALGGGVLVANGATFDGGNENGLLTNGNLDIVGPMTIGSTNTPNTFRASGNHVLEFQSGSPSINLVGSPTYTIENLQVNGATLTMPAGGLAVAGGLSMTSSRIVGSSLIVGLSVVTDAASDLSALTQLAYTGSIFPAIGGGRPVNLVLEGAITLGALTQYSGNITIDNAIDINNRTLIANNITINGSPTAAGAVSMTTGALVANGTLTLNGSVPAITSGNINFAGGLVDNSTNTLASTNISVIKTGSGAATIVSPNIGNLVISTGTLTTAGTVSVFNNFDVSAGTTFIISTGTTFFGQILKLHASSTTTINGTIVFEGCTRDNSNSPAVINGSNTQSVMGTTAECTAAPLP